MKIFVACEEIDRVSEFKAALETIKSLPQKPKIYIVGDMDKWEVVINNDLAGLLKTPAEIRALLKKKAYRI